MKARILSLVIFPGCDGVKVGNGEPKTGERLLGMTRKVNIKMVKEVAVLGKPCAHRTPRISEWYIARPSVYVRLCFSESASWFSRTAFLHAMPGSVSGPYVR